MNQDCGELTPVAQLAFCMKPRQTARTRFVQPGLTGNDISFVGIRHLLTRPAALLIHSLAVRITVMGNAFVRRTLARVELLGTNRKTSMPACPTLAALCRSYSKGLTGAARLTPTTVKQVYVCVGCCSLFVFHVIRIHYRKPNDL